MKKGIPKSFAGKLIIFIICILLSYSAGVFGSFFSASSVSSEWYNSIKPSITPPSWIFPFIWNIIYFLIGVSLFYLWITPSKYNKQRIFVAFAINIIANGFWSFLFFGLQQPVLAFIDLLVILSSLIWIMYFSLDISHKSVYFLMPYLIWLVFAGMLNFLVI